MNILDDLQWRGLMADCTDLAGLAERTAQGPITLYCGFDPTADSLHVGNLVPLLALRRFQLAGHHPIALAGGATGCIGDPSGKTQERQLLSRETIAHNIACIKEQLKRLLDFNCATNPAKLVDNADWMAPITYLDFLRDVGKHFSVNAMIAKESVRARMEDRDTGISYTEFSYMLLQAYDFYHLRKELQCELQIGGSDQWGNITAGIDLARKKLGVTLYGLTLPLITNADGSKFGKSLSGAVYLDPQKTSVYRFYQFWIRTDDRDVIRYLKYFTFLKREEIEALEQKHQANPGAREAHRALAWAMTEMVHGSTAAREAVRASEVLFGGDLEGISAATFQEILGEAPTRLAQPSVLGGTGWPLVEAVVAAGLSPSKGQARKDIESGGIYVNNVRVAEVQRTLTSSDLLFGQYLLLRKGKKNYVIVSFQTA
ncbi:tyrosine--tRNA ligase [Fontisphaera persica]|uniref:tyrosine--tRNA ligase n=1 Tax=Fontisphaera persica TaxID=2974023 RepID=UPI0024C07413|nr:tyrosine--tRNA ligase [Fontisphaera persica]WCJ60362.1 tyrosine--tRNA ligase [Fontisphaera persica]